MTIAPSGRTWTNASGGKVGGFGCAHEPSEWSETSSPPAAAEQTCRNVRRSTTLAPLTGLRRIPNGLPNANVRAAAADVAAHALFNLCVRRLGHRLQQGDGGHDLAALAVAALDDVG